MDWFCAPTCFCMCMWTLFTSYMATCILVQFCFLPALFLVVRCQCSSTVIITLIPQRQWPVLILHFPQFCTSITHICISVFSICVENLWPIPLAYCLFSSCCSSLLRCLFSVSSLCTWSSCMSVQSFTVCNNSTFCDNIVLIKQFWLLQTCSSEISVIGCCCLVERGINIVLVYLVPKR